jgi:PAT family beta-lactamase induction signal transducer AmpG
MSQGLAVYLERRSLVMLALGFSAGLPNLLIFDTLSTWLREAGLSLSTISFFALATLSYSLKFVWAPLVDRTAIPGLTGLVGHRRAWMLATQVAILFGLWGIANMDPATNLPILAALAVAVGFVGATQDIVIDAWRIEAVDTSRAGALAAAYQWGYRLAIVVAGAVPLILAESQGWSFSYAAMAALMLVGIAGALAAPAEAKHGVRPVPMDGLPARPVAEALEWGVRLTLLAAAGLVAGSGLAASADALIAVLRPFGVATDALKAAWTTPPNAVFVQLAAVLVGLVGMVVACWPLPGVRTRPGAWLAGSFGEPLVAFFQRYQRLAGLILALICVYRLSDNVLNLMSPFYLDLGFEKTEIAEVRKVFGVVASMAGVFVGGWFVARYGLLRTMILGSAASPLSNLVFIWLATKGASLTALFVAIGVDNFASGFAGTALIAYMSSLTSSGFTATQYALFSSLYALPGKLLASQSGRIVEAAAQGAEGGSFGALRGLFAGLPPDALTSGAAQMQVSPAAVGVGYSVFFLYSTGIGVIAIVLAWVVGRRQLAEERAAA